MAPAFLAPDGAEVSAPMVVVDMVWPDQSNHHGTLFGGAALSMLDRMAFIVGSKVLRGSVVTAAVSRLDFAAPALAGYLVECRAQVLRRGQRSVTVDTRLTAEDLLSGERTECLSGEFVMVRQSQADAPEVALSGSPHSEERIVRPEPEQQATSDLACATVAEIVFPGHANHRGVLHGGPAMAWMAKAGFVAATRQVRRSLVMAGSEQLNFKAPAHVGDVVEVTARVVSLGRRSVRVQAEMWAESATLGVRRLCAVGELAFVVIDY